MSARDDIERLKALIASGAPSGEVNKFSKEIVDRYAPRCPGCSQPMPVGKCVVRAGERVMLCLPCTGCPCERCQKVRESRNLH